MKGPVLDELDAAIVAALQANARITNRDLAEQLAIAPSTCLERTRALRDAGVITGFHAEIDLTSLDREIEAMISVVLRPQSRQTIESFRHFVFGLEETLAVYVVTGDEDVLIHVAVASTRHLQDFVLDHLTQRVEIAGLKTAVVYEHKRKKVVELLSSQQDQRPARRSNKHRS